MGYIMLCGQKGDAINVVLDIANQKLKTDVNRRVCYPRLRDFLMDIFGFLAALYYVKGGSTFRNVCLCVCVCAVSYTHLTLPTTPYV